MSNQPVANPVPTAGMVDVPGSAGLQPAVPLTTTANPAMTASDQVTDSPGAPQPLGSDGSYVDASAGVIPDIGNTDGIATSVPMAVDMAMGRRMELEGDLESLVVGDLMDLPDQPGNVSKFTGPPAGY